MVIFETEDLSFSYPGCSEKALDNVNLKIDRGDFVLMMGKTGSGKSTLLSLLKKEISPVGSLSGSIDVNAKSVSFVCQNPEVSFVCEYVRGELAFALENTLKNSFEIAVKIGEIASYFNLSDLLDSRISNLSGGEKAMVSIAAAMVGDCDALILDEPFAWLDPKAAEQLTAVLKRINDELGVTVIVASHSSQGLVDICDKIIIMENGRMICDDTADNLKFSDSAIDFFPVCTKLFTERPLNVKQAIGYAEKLNEKKVAESEKSETVLKVKNLTFAYEKKGRDILSSLDFIAYKGKIHAVIGANGSGKTTFLKAVAGIKKAYAGKVKCSGKIAYLPQNVRSLFTKDTVGEEISDKTAKAFHLDAFMNRHPYDLSGGQMQRLGLAILSEQEFDIILMDEPTKGIDVFGKKDLEKYMKSLCSAGKTVIFVSHDLDFVGDVSDYVSFLSDSVIAMTGERRRVLSGLNYYTTQIRRITKLRLSSAVSAEDLL